MARRRRGSGDVAGPVQVHGAGQVAGEVVRSRVAAHVEPAVDHPDLRILEARGDPFGRPEEVRAGEGAHRDNLAVRRVTLYERAGCHLCEDVRAALGRIGGVTIERKDIAADPALERRYLIRIPVVAVAEAELDAAGLSDREIAAWLATVSHA